MMLKVGALGGAYDGTLYVCVCVCMRGSVWLCTCVYTSRIFLL